MPEIYTYKIKSYINASHAVRWEGGNGKQHNHTWEVITEITLDDDQLVPFNQIEDMLKQTFGEYNGKFLNEVAPFDTINPTLENITKLLFKLLSRVLKGNQANLVRLEVGESPTRFFCISLKGD